MARWVRPSETSAGLFWAAIVGALAGLSAIAFRAGFAGILWFWTHHTGSPETVAAQIPWWQPFIVPVAGGLLAGLTLYFGSRFGRGDRSADYMEAVAVQKGALSVRKSLAKTISSLLTIGSGGSIGREGAMVQLSATVASVVGKWVKLSTPRQRLIVACGAAGGIAAVYNVTVAAALFVAEIVLGSIAIESLGPLLAAALTSSIVSRYVGMEVEYFHSPSFRLSSPWELTLYAAMAVLLGCVAPAYIWMLRRAEDLMTRLVPTVYLRLAAGGAVVGALAMAYPEVWGNGRSMVNLILSNPWPSGILAAILICKFAATAATTGSGAVGGVFTPTLFTGAMLSCLFGHVVTKLWPALAPEPRAYALVGMAGFLAAATRAPLMAIAMLLEITLNYGLVLPIVGVCVVSYYTARALHGDSVYSESLRRKQQRGTASHISSLRVRDIMIAPDASVLESAPHDEIERQFSLHPYHHLPVVTLDGRLIGGIAIEDLEQRLRGKTADEWIRAGSLIHDEWPVITEETTLQDGLKEIEGRKAEHFPVVNNREEQKLVGHVSRTDILLSLQHGIQGSTH